MASYPHAVRLPEIQPEIIEVNASARPLPEPKAKEPKFVIRMVGSVPM